MARRTRVLVVDDEEGMVSTLCDVLAAHDLEVSSANRGDVAIEQARAERPDWILMDVRMPGMNGIEVTSVIKREFPDVRILLMTAYSESDLIRQAEAEGVIEVLAKPLDLERIVGMVCEQRSLLVVDDDPEFCLTLQDALADEAFVVEKAYDLDSAMEIFERRPESLVLLDMKLPGTSGLAALRELKQRDPKVIVILMSGHSEYYETMQQGLELSASGYLVKPFEIAELVANLEHALQRGHSHA